MFCTRRAAKSYSAGLKAIKCIQRMRRVSVLIVGLVRLEVKRIYWDPILKDVNERYRLGLTFNETELTVRNPRNGSVIYLLGADANESEKRKILGQKFPLVIIDEAQDFVTDLSALVFHVLKAAVADYRGSICLLGTPGLIAKGLFYDVTTGKEPGWKRHEWSALDNPYIAENWKAEIEELKRIKPGVEQTPWFRRNYLREWVIDEDALVYRYLPGRNDYTELPKRTAKGWHRVLGIDLGYDDATAFVLGAYHDHDPTLYFEFIHKQSGMDVTDVANKVHWFEGEWEIDHLVIDGANKQAVEEMRRRHGLPLIAADKTGKADFIEIMNAELILGRVKLHADLAKPLADEYRALIWDMKKAKREEHAACENHAADAALYAWRHSYQYLSQEPAPPPTEEEALEEAAMERFQATREPTSGLEDSSQWEWQWR